MTATDQMRNMINELMGSDKGEGGGKLAVPFSDYTVCRSYLVGCCPHDILSSTRMDLGNCVKTHDIALRADYERAQKDKDMFYDIDALDHLERFFDDCDRKMEIAKKRLAETQAELGNEAAEKADVVLEINEDIGKTLAEAERLGEDGQVEESLKMMEKLEALKTKKQEAETEYRASLPASSFQQQKLRVCEVCGAYLGIHDNDRRLADHFGGKLHMGFVFLRERMAELRVDAPQRRGMRPTERGGGDRGRAAYESRRADRYRDTRDRERGSSRRHRSRSRSRDRSVGGRSRESETKSSRKRSRSRSRDRDRDRKRQSDHHHRHRHSDKHKKTSRSTSRDKDKPAKPSRDSKDEKSRNGSSEKKPDSDSVKEKNKLSDVDD